jgi:hypothetical protein
MLYFGHQMGAHDAKECGLVAQVFPHTTFEQEVWHKLEQFAQMPKQVMLDFVYNKIMAKYFCTSYIFRNLGPVI